MIRKFLLGAEIRDIKFYKVALVFLPLLFIYTIIVILFSTNILQGDEGGYMRYATRIVTGLYFSSPTDVQLWWGIGYPLILVPFVALNIPLIYIKILNALFLYGAILFLYNTLNNYIRPIIALVIAFLGGLYLPFLRELPFILSESLTYFLVAGFIYYSCRLLKHDFLSLVDLLLAAFFMAYLALTKVFYGYMILVCVVLYGAFYIWSRSEKFRLLVLMYIIALIFCVPYLIGTYMITGNIYYWGTSGGMSLYWMSTPYANEWGDWFSADDVKAIPELNINHGMDFQKISSLSQPAMDAALKKLAIENIIHNPKKFFINWLANLGRLVFGYPHSYTQQDMTIFYYLVPNVPLITFFLFSLVPALFRWKQIPYEIKTSLFFAILAFLGTSLLSAFVRLFTALVPFLIVWMSFIYFKIINIHLTNLEIPNNTIETVKEPIKREIFW